ncbi:MAG: PEP-CTERM sorting domain-containing protein [Bryobacteraceae bacterium]
MLSGNLFEDVSALVATGGTGPFTQTLTFTGGTGMFAGASGSASGGGLAGPTGFTASGSGTLTAPAIVPEPASVALIFGGLLVMLWAQAESWCGSVPFLTGEAMMKMVNLISPRSEPHSTARPERAADSLAAGIHVDQNCGKIGDKEFSVDPSSR